MADFTAQADGLGDEQRTAVERWSVEQRRHVARAVTDHIADSVGAAEAGHRGRFGRWLRGTPTAMMPITVMTIVCTAVVVGTVA
ncbi:hypothetical protein [Streptomyces sp. NPDC088812]|uniref:hypothetical protein n=1 Tax=Streptomyces sp. NPDC088812 TaxID=3365905 RepID=UPI0038019D2E